MTWDSTETKTRRDLLAFGMQGRFGEEVWCAGQPGIWGVS